MEKKQTAVEWLENQYIKHSGNLLEMKKSFEQAKEMEKQQMEDCWRFGRGSHIDKEPETFEQYYNQEFGDNSKQVQPKEVDLGEMINVWIEHHGFLDLSTDEQEIINFYNKIQGGNK